MRRAISLSAAIGALAAGLVPRPAWADEPLDRGGAAAQRVVAEERGLMTVLAGWALGSVSAGAVLVTSDDRQLRYAGVQSLAWGAVDGAIAGVALATAKAPDDPARERARLSRLFWINAALDVAYVTAGMVMMAASSDDAWKGTGAGIIAQGGFLLAFDTTGALVIAR